MAYWHQLLEVDLTAGDHSTAELSEEFVRTHLGGAGFTTRLLYDRVGPDVDPLDPENVLAVAPGVLVGPSVPTGSKTTFGFKSPLTGGYGKSLVGAKMGDQLKRAGYDALTITGACDEPSVLVIEDDDVRLEPADDLWGLDTRETHDRLEERYGSAFRSAIIGPAGEHESRISMIECEDRQAGRGGPGAVMGSKNLKAIAVKGSMDVPVARPDELEELNQKWRLETTGRGEIEISGTGDASVDVQYGTGEALDAKNTALGIFPTRNWQSGYFERAYERLEDPSEDRISLDPRSWTEEYVDTKRPCPYCTKPCSQFFEAEDTEYGDIAVDGPEYETQYALGGNVAVDDIEAVSKANEICDRLGLDTIDAGNAIAWAMEAEERGLLEDIETEVDLEFGDAHAVLETLRKMARAEGDLGELLKDGHVRAARRAGGGEEFAVHVKNQAPAGFEPRGIKGMALAFGVSPRGADHLTSCLYALEMNGDFWEFENYDRTRMDGKALALKSMEDLMAVYDITGVCKFTRGLTLEEGVRELVNAITGFDLSRSELLTTGERMYNLSKAFNVREGFDRDDDRLPARFTEEVPNGPNEGESIDEELYERELDRYYTARGWDTDGVPLTETLGELDLLDVADDVGVTNEIAVGQ
ncbi:aldehyde ferredoxin oxidoreductase family protein [Halobiforma nitratireducens]|uniref:Tungsten-containing aldehyde ferredoxin oxidoreductase (Aor) n=1 Tax=Halobiforma nitratireducens JCM 10879 TaxID=1227454 RepID=M0LWC7_9EURY|nr:aldehyde ferredoxin oxidoreductase family protein [Halobiforma nitratireducens]EMA36654.1 Tungsten-containing aldehyde ferredoxin oxidoreductase (aor) [Halobiforma nitratireducens JCM 10879]